jgi:hypothetical protein
MNIVKKQVILIAVLFLSACSKQMDKSSANETSGKELNGAWEWVRTDGGLANHIHDTPGSIGKTVVLNISSNKRYSVFTNGVQASQGTYTLETRTCIHDRTDKMYLVFSSGQGMMVEKIDGESLLLSDEAMDGVGSLYKRIGSSVK